MSSSVADGTTLKRKERNEQGNVAARMVQQYLSSGDSDGAS
jgi:hypothetical protein